MSIPPDSDPDSLSDSLLARLYAALELDDDQRDAAIDELCDLHPDHAATLREYAARAQNNESLPCRDFLDRVLSEPDAAQRYELHEVVGRGGMGVVYRARDRHLDRIVAMKVIEPKESKTEGSIASQVLQRFVDEAQITGQLDHPGVVPVYQVGTGADGQVWFTMRLVRGRTLDAILRLTRERKEGWTTTRALEVLVKICDTLAFAHSRQVVHRDLKPSNVMVGRFGEVYVMDWGLARVLTRDDRRDMRIRPHDESQSRVKTSRSREVESDPDSPLVTMEGAVVGTPSFMALEQAEGRIDQVGPRSDVYSVGGILYSLLTGHAPYLNRDQKVSPYTLLRAVLDGPPKPVHDIAPEAPDELVAICEKAMSRDIDARYTDCRQMAHDIRAYLEGRVVQAHRTGALAEMRMWFRRNRAFALAAGLAVVMLAAGGVAFLVAANEAERAEREGSLRESAESARKAAEQAKVEVEFARDRTRYTRRLLEAELAMESGSRRAKRALDNCVESMRGPEWYVLRMQAEGSAWHATAPDSTTARFARFADDSARLLTADARHIHIWAPPATEPIATFTHTGSEIDSIAAAPDLSRIVSSGGGQLAVWETGSDTPIMTTPCRKFFASSDCRLVAYTRKSVATVWDRDSDRPFVARQYGSTLTPQTYLERVVSGSVREARQVRSELLTTVNVRNYVLSKDRAKLKVERIDPPKAPHTVGAYPFVPRFPGQRPPRVKPRAKDKSKLEPTRVFLGSFLGHERSIVGIAVSPDEQWAVTHSTDGEIRMWSIPALTRSHGVDVVRPELPILPRSIDWHVATHACVSPDGTRAVTRTDAGGIWLWDLEDMTPIDVVRGVRPVRNIEFLDDTTVLAFHSDGTIVRFEHTVDPTWTELVCAVPADASRVTIATKARQLFYATDNEYVTAVSLDTGEVTSTTPIDGPCRRLAVADDGTTIAWATTGRLAVCDIESGNVQDIAVDKVPTSLALHGERRLIAAVYGRSIQLMELDDLEPFRELESPRGTVRHASFENRGLTLFAIDSRGDAHWWSTTGESEPLASHPIGTTGARVWVRDGGRVIWDLQSSAFGLRRRSFTPEYRSPLVGDVERDARDLLATQSYASLPTALQRQQRLAQDVNLDDDVRDAALRLARIDGDDIDALEIRCWNIVSNPTRSREQYLDGLLTAEQLTRQFPETEILRTDLGLALYRLERLDDALATLATVRADGSTWHDDAGLLARGLAAACLVRLGRPTEAREAARDFRNATRSLVKRESVRRRLFGERGARELRDRLLLLHGEILEQLEQVK